MLGLWASLWILAIVITGLPWSVVWGGLLNRAGQMAGEGFPKEVFAARPHSTSSHELQDISLNQVIATAHRAGIKDGFAIEYPWGENGSYAIMPLRHGHTEHNTVHYAFIDRRNADLLLTISDAEMGAVGRATSIGVQFHEGRLFGNTNQLLNALAVTILMLLGITGWVMWLKRRPKGAFGAPRATFPIKHHLIFSSILGILCVLLPLFGASVFMIILYETFMRHIRKVHYNTR